VTSAPPDVSSVLEIVADGLHRRAIRERAARRCRRSVPAGVIEIWRVAASSANTIFICQMVGDVGFV
jgi:hypothetical protein